jgi:hypothetical protein
MDANAIAAAVVEQVVGLIDKRLTPIMERLNALESVEQVKAQDVSAEVVRSILDGDNLEHIVSLKVAEYLIENPPPAGEKGMDGKDGADGKDGVGLAGALIDRDGSLVVTLTNGEVKSLGSVVGKDGADGRLQCGACRRRNDYPKVCGPEGKQGIQLQYSGSAVSRLLARRPQVCRG